MKKIIIAILIIIITLLLSYLIFVNTKSNIQNQTTLIDKNLDELQIYILKQIEDGAPGLRYGCGKNNKINGYDCGSTFDQASMINMYSELYLATNNKNYLIEALNFGILGNSTCGLNQENNICGEAKQQGEITMSLLKLYLISKNTEIKNMLNKYLNVNIKNINLKNGNNEYHNWGIFSLAQTYISGSYFLKNKEYLKKYYKLKEKVNKKSIFFQNLLLLENLYLNKKNTIDYKIYNSLNEEKEYLSKYGKLDYIELLKFNKINKKFNSNLLEIKSDMLNGRKLLTYSYVNKLNLHNSITIESLGKLNNFLYKDKHYIFANEGDNYSPFYMGIYNIIFNPINKLNWNLNKEKYQKIYDKNPILKNYKSDITLKKRKLFCLATLKENSNNNLTIQLYLKNNTSEEMIIKPIFDENYIKYNFNTNLIKKIKLNNNDELLFNFNIKSNEFENIFYGLYFEYNGTNTCYIDSIYIN